MTKKNPIEIRENIEAQMNIAQDLVSRNPWLTDLNEKYPDHFVLKGANPEDYAAANELDIRFAEIYGEVFPSFPFPVLPLSGTNTDDPSALILRIDLNFTKEELLSYTAGFINSALKNYRKDRTVKHERKYPKLWMDYLELWDLMDGYAPWKRDSEGFPYAPSMEKLERRLTYEDIAKKKYPDALSPEDLKKAVDRIKKQYRTAIKFICGKAYRADEIDIKRSENDTLCDKCGIRANCEEACPALLRALRNEEIGQRDKLINRPADIEKYKKPLGKKKPTADNQF